MTPDEEACHLDIDAEVPQNDELTADQRAKLDQLYEQFRQRLSEDGGQWPEFKGDGQ